MDHRVKECVRFNNHGKFEKVWMQSLQSATVGQGTQVHVFKTQENPRQRSLLLKVCPVTM